MATLVSFTPTAFDDLSADEKIDYLELLWSRITRVCVSILTP